MTVETIIPNIVSGTTSGVTAGLILAVIFYSLQWTNRKIQRRKEIAYLRQVIVDFQQKVISATDDAKKMSESDPNQPPVPIELLRWMWLRDANTEVKRTLNSSAKTLSYIEKEQLAKTLRIYDAFKKNGIMGLEQDAPIGPANYHGVFDQLEEVPWLNLPIIDRGEMPRDNRIPE